MMTIMCIMVGLTGIGLIVAATAPVGYQDENGFHFGRERTMSPDGPRCKTPS